MKRIGRFTRLAAVGGAVVIGLAASAEAASAISIDGISGNPYAYTGTADSAVTWTFGGGVVTCETAEFSGIATGAPAMSGDPVFGGCNVLLGGSPYPVTVSVSGAWSVTATSLTGTTFGMDLDLGSSTTTIIIPGVCTITVPGGQSFPAGMSGTNQPDGFFIEASIAGMDYSLSGLCPGVSDLDDGTFESNGPITFPGLVVNP